ncbi:AAA family ATPase [Nonomuraea endophytica]|uniref:AAA+ superfamily predicted ATPase n=1 Tax=Nonomuraea endophytica TaxID=714136 RepID=A0A7W8A9S6_9ACTN|nr:AAA family ATPase [Nonomuraea endophytica]MBB5081260.1 AAA+ superfamily predicted ATPase [Nonomuraea endophytica]
MVDDSGLQALREAARLSPDNLPLRRHLADLLLDKGYLAEAEREYRAALLLAPRDPGITAGLAEAFARQGAYGAALSALEPFLAQPGYPPRMGVIAARALLDEGDVAQAGFRYHEAVMRAPEAADPELAARLAAPVPPRVSQPVEEPFGKRAEEPAEPYDQRVTFADVAGMEGVKEALRVKLLLPVQQPELFAAFGKRAGGGVLLYGPPGGGKTHLARAAAGELGASFVSVGLSDVLDMYVGQSERNLHNIFDAARRSRPCVLFFDEVDALAARRSDMRQAHNRQIVNQFLAELDGVDDKANEGVLVLAATNAPWYIDVAFRRPGRFDQLVFVPPPDLAARAAILRILCRDKPLAEMDFDAVAKATTDYVGADLKGLVDRAVEDKLRESIAAGRPVPLTTRDLLALTKSQRPSSVREWLATARNYVMHANDSGAWDELLPWVNRTW